MYFQEGRRDAPPRWRTALVVDFQAAMAARDKEGEGLMRAAREARHRSRLPAWLRSMFCDSPPAQDGLNVIGFPARGEAPGRR